MGCQRGTSNSNDRGNTRTRAKRRAWLLDTWAADEPLLRVTWADGQVEVDRSGTFGWRPDWLREQPGVAEVEVLATARCYRCGALVHDGTVSVDRINPGGPYSNDNIRPACDNCNSATGGHLAAARSVGKVAVRRNRPRPAEQVDDELPLAAGHG